MKLKFLITIIAFSLMLASSGCSNVSAKTELEPLPMKLDDYWEYNPEIIVDGRVVINDEIYLSFPMSGRIADLSVEEGDIVKEGDLIANLNKSIIESQLNNAKAALLIAEANLYRTQVGSHQSQIDEAERIIESIQAREVSLDYNSDEKAADLGAAEARLAYLKALPLPEDVSVAEAEVVFARAEFYAVETNLKLTEIIAPRDGTITSVLIHAHEYARAGEPVITLGDISNLGVEVEMDDFEAQEILLGEKVTIRFYGLSGESVFGTITKISPNERLTGGDFIVLVKLDDVPDNLRKGMMAEVRFPRD